MAVFAPRLAPRVFLVALAANLWLAGWWVVALVGLAAALLPLGLACARRPRRVPPRRSASTREAVALSPFGPSQAGRFYGVSNLLETFLLVPALLGAALLGRRGSRRRGARGRRRRRQPVRRRRRRPARPARRRTRRSRCGRAASGLDARRARRARGRGASSRDRRSSASTRRSAGRATSRTRSATGPARSSATSPTGSSSPPDGRSRRRARRSPRSPRWPSLVWSSRRRRPRRPVTDALLVALAVSLVVNDTPGDVLGVGAVAAFAAPPVRGRHPARRPGHLDRLRAMRRRSPLSRSCSPRSRSSWPGAARARSTRDARDGRGDDPRRRRRAAARTCPALELTGDAAAGETVFASAGCGACHTLSAAGSSGTVGPNLDDAAAVVRARRRARHARPGRDAVVRRPARAAADRRRRPVRRRLDGRLILPPGFPRARRGVRVRPRPHADRRATAMLRPRTLRGDRARRATPGIPVVVATGRMFRSVAPYLERRRDRRAGRLLPGRRRRRPARRASSSSTSRSSSASRGRRSPRSRERGLRRTSTSTTSSTSREHTDVLARLRGLPAPAGDRGRRPPRLARPRRRRSSSRSASRERSPALRGELERAASAAASSSRPRCRTCSSSATRT